MHIIAVDDEALARKALEFALGEVFAEDEIHSFSKARDCIAWLKEFIVDHEVPAYAFLDIQLRGYTGIQLAREIKEISPDITVIFVTAYNDYASEAFAVHASGYLLKPVDEESIRKAISNIVPARVQTKTGWTPIATEDEPKLCIRTFGKFTATVGKKELIFERSKSKELLALLVDKRGTGLTNGDIEAYLWEDSLGDKRKSGYVQKVISSLIKTLREAGVEDVIEKHYNYLALRTELIECDLYAFLQGDVSAVNSYYGVYMEEYSWGETTTGLLEQWR